jgi:hypothetical protein
VKIAGAPISWGVSEVLGWGYQLPVDRVLREMREVGLTATAAPTTSARCSDAAAEAGSGQSCSARASRARRSTSDGAAAAARRNSSAAPARSPARAVRSASTAIAAG